MELFHQFHFYDKELPLIALKARDLEFRAHWHSEIELLYVLSGTIFASANQSRKAVGPGALVACGSRSIHSYERVSEHSETIVVLFKPEIIGNRSAWPMAGCLTTSIASRNEHQEFSQKMESLVLPLLDEMTEKRPGYNSVARGYVLQLCGLIERELSGGVSSHADERGLSHPLERIQAAIDYIYEKAEYPISLHDVAEVASLSPWYFSRVFKKTIGTSFRIFVNEVRIERAESLMADGTKTLAEIALESGFDNLRTFNEVFRAIRGTTPSQSRAGMGCGPRIPEQGLKTDPTHFPQFHNVSKGEAPAHIGT